MATLRTILLVLSLMCNFAVAGAGYYGYRCYRDAREELALALACIDLTMEEVSQVRRQFERVQADLLKLTDRLRIFGDDSDSDLDWQVVPQRKQ